MNIILIIIYYFFNLKLIIRDRIYLIPFIFSFYTNVFGLLDPEIIQLPVGLDFRDIGLILTLLLIIKYRRKISIYKNKAPFIITIVYLIYLTFLFFYSYVIDESNFIESIKIGRTWMYGFFIVLVFQLISWKNPFENYKKLINFLYPLTITLTVLYIIQNQFNIDIFGAKDYEVISLNGIEARRNFYAYPFFSAFCIIYSLNSFLESKEKRQKVIHLSAYLILMLGTIYVLTRGLVIISISVSFLLLFYRRFDFKKTITLFVIIIVGYFIFDSGVLERINSFNVLLERMKEISDSGIRNTNNFQVRNIHFLNSVKNVLDFNPIFGFGYTLPAKLGYNFMLFHAGNPDNAFANIIGIQGFFGLFLFVLMVSTWLIINIKLQRQFSDPFTKIHFFVFLWLLMTAFNGNSFSYINNFALFFAYDIVSYYTRIRLNK